MTWEDLNKLTQWMCGFQYPCRCGRGKEKFRVVRINVNPFRVPKGLEVFFQQWLTVAPWDFDVVSILQHHNMNLTWPHPSILSLSGSSVSVLQAHWPARSCLVGGRWSDIPALAGLRVESSSTTVSVSSHHPPPPLFTSNSSLTSYLQIFSAHSFESCERPLNTCHSFWGGGQFMMLEALTNTSDNDWRTKFRSQTSMIPFSSG